jgi:GGDEF domain-containing protein
VAILDVDDPFKPKSVALDIEDPFSVPKTPVASPAASSALPVDASIEMPSLQGGVSAPTRTPPAAIVDTAMPADTRTPLEKGVDIATAVPRGAYQGITRGLPELVGKGIEFAGSHLPGGSTIAGPGETNAVEDFGKATSEFSLSPTNFGRMTPAELATEKTEAETRAKRGGAEALLYSGGEMLGPSVGPGLAINVGMRVILGVGKLARLAGMASRAAEVAKVAGDAAKAAELFGRAEKLGSQATRMAKLAATSSSVGVGGAFGLSQAQQTRDTALARAAQLEKTGDAAGAAKMRESAYGIAPYLAGTIEAVGETLGTRYLGKLFGVDEAVIVKKGLKQFAVDMLKTAGVEVGTEMGQQYGEAGVEKLSGIRPEAQPWEEAKSVVGPTLVLTALTGGLARGGQTLLERTKPGVAEPSDQNYDILSGKNISPRSAIPEPGTGTQPPPPPPGGGPGGPSTADREWESALAAGTALPTAPPPPASATPDHAIDLTDYHPTSAPTQALKEGYIESRREAAQGAAVPVSKTEREQTAKADRVMAAVLQELESEGDVDTALGKAEAEIATPATAVGAPETALPPSGPIVPPTAEEGLKQRAAQPGQIELPMAPTEPGVNLPEGQAKPVLSALPEIGQKAHEAATSPLNTIPQPTPAQREAGNYRKGHVNVQGLDISVENPRGSIRTSKPGAEKAWKTVMRSHYGYIKGTIGRDKDHIDAFIGPNEGSQRVFVVNQLNPKTGKFDEHKVMLGYDDADIARQSYLDNYEKDWEKKGFGSMVAMTMGEFKTWIREGDTKTAIGEKQIEAKDRLGLPVRSTSFNEIDRRSPDRKAWDAYDAAVKAGDTEKAKKIAETLAYKDRLTGLTRREGWEHDEVEGKHDQYSRRFFLDFDNFHDTNIRLTHAGGDQVLAFFGKLMRFHLGDGAEAARWGGDEFVGAGNEDLGERLRGLQGDAEAVVIPIELTAGMEYPKGSGKILTEPLHIEQHGIRLSFGVGKNHKEAYSANERDKQARKAAGLRHEREEAPAVPGGAGEQPAAGGEVRTAIPAEVPAKATEAVKPAATALPEEAPAAANLFAGMDDAALEALVNTEIEKETPPAPPTSALPEEAPAETDLEKAARAKFGPYTWESTPQEMVNQWYDAFGEIDDERAKNAPKIKKLQEKLKALGKGKKTHDERRTLLEEIGRLQADYKIPIYEAAFMDAQNEIIEAAAERAKKDGVPEEDIDDFYEDFGQNLSDQRPFIEHNYNLTVEQIYQIVVQDHLPEGEAPAETAVPETAIPPTAEAEAVAPETALPEVEAPTPAAVEAPEFSGKYFTDKMKAAQYTDDGQMIIREHETAINELEKSAGLTPTVGRVEQKYYRGFSAVKRAEWQKRVAELAKIDKNKAEKLKVLIADGTLMGVEWEKVLKTKTNNAESDRRAAELEREALAAEAEAAKKNKEIQALTPLAEQTIVDGKIKTITGREIPAPPEIRTATAQKAKRDMQRVEGWLKVQAWAEAESRSDGYNKVWIGQLHPGKFSQADKDMANEYLFNEANPKFVNEKAGTKAETKQAGKEWPQPNKNGVYPKENAEHTEYRSKKASADINVLQTNKGWINAITYSHKVGQQSGMSEPLSTDNPVFETREQAFADAANRLVAHQKKEARGVMKKGAEEITKWANWTKAQVALKNRIAVNMQKGMEFKKEGLPSPAAKEKAAKIFISQAKNQSKAAKSLRKD